MKTLRFFLFYLFALANLFFTQCYGLIVEKVADLPGLVYDFVIVGGKCCRNCSPSIFTRRVFFSKKGEPRVMSLPIDLRKTRGILSSSLKQEDREWKKNLNKKHGHDLKLLKETKGFWMLKCLSFARDWRPKHRSIGISPRCHKQDSMDAHCRTLEEGSSEGVAPWVSPGFTMLLEKFTDLFCRFYGLYQRLFGRLWSLCSAHKRRRMVLEKAATVYLQSIGSFNAYVSQHSFMRHIEWEIYIPSWSSQYYRRI